MPRAAHMIDVVSCGGIVCIVATFYLLLLSSIIIGVIGPHPLTILIDKIEKTPCIILPDCPTVVTPLTLSNLASYNQLIALNVAIIRPDVDVALDYKYYSQSYVLTITGTPSSGSDVVILSNQVSHTAQIECEAGSKECTGFLIAYYPEVDFATYTMNILWQNPLSQWNSLNPDGKISMHFTGYTVPIDYTSFQLGYVS
jgi:hypothetical protein